MGFRYRPYGPEDVAFMIDSWGRSYFQGSRAYQHLEASEFHAYHRPIRERFFSRPSAAGIICCPQDDPWHIIAWIAVEKLTSGLVVQYLYVKDAFRQQGIARQLIEKATPIKPVFYTHTTGISGNIVSKHPDEFASWHLIPHLV